MNIKSISSFLCAFLFSITAYSETITLLNVSYDPTRELYQDLNQNFTRKWEKEHDKKVTIQQSHGGSGKQARAVIDGLEADVVTLALSYDIDEISLQSGLISEEWQRKLPANSAPYTSTIVFLVRKGNPKNIRDWDDLVRPDVSVITPNPKTSGGARWNYMAAWGFAMKKFNNNEKEASNFLKSLFANVPVLDTGARGATTTFVQRKIGDVFISWENEALLAEREIGVGEVEIVTPSVSILAEPSVTVVDKIVDKHKTREVAEGYLSYLYENEAQDIIAKHFFRPRSEDILKKYNYFDTKVSLFTISDISGTWKAAQEKHFKDGALFDQVSVSAGTK